VAGRITVGLDIGTTAVRAAELSVGKGQATLQRFGQVALHEGAVRDGIVLDAEPVAEAIHTLWRSARFSTRKVVVGVANQKVVVRQVDLPWMPPAEQRKALPMHAADLIPMPVDQAILDMHIVEEVTGENGRRMLRVLLVAAARDMVTGMLKAVTKAGLKPQTVDLTSFAVLRATAARDVDGPVATKADAVVDIGSGVTNLVVHQGGALRFARILMMGGGNITAAVAERVGIPFTQAEGIKQSLGMAAVAGVQPTAEPAERALEASAAALVDEIRGSLDYYLAQPDAVPLGRLLLSGGGGRLANFAERLSLATRLPVEPAGAFSVLHIGRTGLSAEQISYVEPVATVPVGLALGVAS
jgi:type IV pilus assembly protein PilM